MKEQQDQSSCIAATHDLVRTLEAQYLPLLRRLAGDLAERHPDLDFNVHSSSVGSRTPYQGHNISLDCVFPGRSAEQPDSVCLEISLCCLTTRPRVMVDVVWGAPSGYSEASFPSVWSAQEDWPEATVSGLSKLAESFGNLCL